MALLHGGQLSRVAKEFGTPENKWLDLSTGIAPFSYPIPEIPLQVWQALPMLSEQLINAAKQYYQAPYCWPLSGSQNLIEKLPQLWREKYPGARHVYLPKVGYKEHQQAWAKAGFTLHFYQSNLPEEIHENAVVVVINPNNPLTDLFSIHHLTALTKRCAQANALLIIDEAFVDILPAQSSFVTHLKTDSEDVLVLRSFGKFFGLAGVRIGFVCSGVIWYNKIQQSTGPWAVNGPALYIAQLALQDRTWQLDQVARLKAQSKRQQQLLAQYLPVITMKANALFITVFLKDAPAVYEQLCKQSIYVRLTDENDALRFGIANDLQFNQLAERLGCLKNDA